MCGFLARVAGSHYCVGHGCCFIGTWRGVMSLDFREVDREPAGCFRPRCRIGVPRINWRALWSRLSTVSILAD